MSLVKIKSFVLIAWITVCTNLLITGFSAGQVINPDNQIGDLDLSGDGVADIVHVIQPSTSINGDELLVLGCTNDIPWTPGRIEIVDSQSGAIHCTIQTDETWDELGNSISATTDINQDGIIDLIVGASGHSVRGLVFVFYGPFVNGQTRLVSEADLTLFPPHNLDHEFGHKVAPIADLTEDDIPEIRIRSVRGAILEGRFITHLYDGSSGDYLVSISSTVVDGMWKPIEGDLNDNGQVDVTDVERLLGQFGRVTQEHRVWADLDDQGVVTTGDYVEQMLMFGEHPGLTICREALIAKQELQYLEDTECYSADLGFEDCCIYVVAIDGTEEIKCDEDPAESPYECVRNLPDLPLSDALRDCLLDDPCYQAWSTWLEQLGLQNWPWPPTIHYVDCTNCENSPGGFMDPPSGEIWICIQQRSWMSEEALCRFLKEALLEEMLHWLQYYQNHPFPPSSDLCGEAGCWEFQAGVLIQCISSETPCLCGLQYVIDNFTYRIRAETDPILKNKYEKCLIDWTKNLDIANQMPNPEEFACLLLDVLCEYNGINGPYPECDLIPAVTPSNSPTATIEGRLR